MPPTADRSKVVLVKKMAFKFHPPNALIRPAPGRRVKGRYPNGMIQQVLAEPEWQARFTMVDLQTLSPLKWQHVSPLWDFHSEHARAASAEPDGAVRSRYFAEISAFARLRPERAGRVSRGEAATVRHIDANDQRG